MPEKVYPSYTLEEVRAFASIRNMAEVRWLLVLKSIDQKADKWDDWQRHINSGAEVFGE